MGTLAFRMSCKQALSLLFLVLARLSWGCLQRPPPASSTPSATTASSASPPENPIADPSLPTEGTTSCSTEPDTRCKNANGYCMDASSCPGGNHKDNLCPGDASNKCCLSAPFDEPSCEDVGGRCLDECACEGEVRTGLCGSQPAAIRCCIEDELVDDCSEENQGPGPWADSSDQGTENEPNPLNPSSCPGGFTSNCNNGECVVTCSNAGGGPSPLGPNNNNNNNNNSNNNNNNSNNNNNNNNNNGRRKRRRKRSTGEPCPATTSTSTATTTQDDSKKDWQTIDLGNVCDCWSKEKSKEAARVDKSKLDKYSSSFEAASTKHNIPKEVLMAVASRESRAGSALGLNGNKPGYGDHNNGFGLMQVDVRYHTVADPSNIDNVDQGADILASMLKQVKEKHPDWSEGWQLRGAVAAYNFGAKNVQTKSGIDKGSASTCSPCDGNYSWDTIQRARWLADN